MLVALSWPEFKLWRRLLGRMEPRSGPVAVQSAEEADFVGWARPAQLLQRPAFGEQLRATGRWSQHSCAQPHDGDCFVASAPQGISRQLFPDDFVFGTATSAYQVEGAAAAGGRGLSIWDEFAHTPGKTTNGDTGDVACNQYHRFEEDADLMASMGLRAYRFSISWSRLLPAGVGAVNEEGVAYYSRLIDSLLERGITPYATLFHWDLPLALHKSYGGFLSPQIVPAFVEYARLCFERFGGRVRHWMTFNEPLTFATLGFCTGDHAPGRCSDRTRCPEGDSSSEPYLVVHHILLAHAAAAKLYRTRFKGPQGGSIGIAADCEWAEPLTTSAADADAAERRLEFLLAWILDPLFFGDYPRSMRANVGARLPSFNQSESAELMSAGIDFVGLNHYTSRYVAHLPEACGQEEDVKPSWGGGPSTFFSDQRVSVLTERNGVAIGWQAASPWLIAVPWGIRKLLLWISWRYGRPPIFITENGVDEWAQGDLSLEDALTDEHRIEYHSQYLLNVAAAIQDGAEVRGYFAWSFVDNFEWQRGFSSCFGLIHVDRSTPSLPRRMKLSAHWLKKFLLPESSTRNGKGR